MKVLSKWQDDYNKAIREDITLPQYHKRFAEWMNNWIKSNTENIDKGNVDEAAEKWIVKHNTNNYGEEDAFKAGAEWYASLKIIM